jgi:hypothetical protein
MAKQTDRRITQSSEFKAVDKTHKDIHKYATASWEARESGDISTAMSYFNKTHDAYFEYQKAIRKLSQLLKSLGFTDMTEIVVYGK